MLNWNTTLAGPYVTLLTQQVRTSGSLFPAHIRVFPSPSWCTGFLRASFFRNEHAERLPHVFERRVPHVSYIVHAANVFRECPLDLNARDPRNKQRFNRHRGGRFRVTLKLKIFCIFVKHKICFEEIRALFEVLKNGLFVVF